MIKSNYFHDNEDLQMHIHHFIDWQGIVDAYEDGFRDAQVYKKTGNERLTMSPTNFEEALEYYKAIMNSTGEIAGNDISQLAQSADAKGLHFENGLVTHPQEIVDVVEKCYSAGIIPTSFKRKYGGLGLPNVVKAICLELFYRADASITIAAGTVNLAAILEKFAGEEICNKYIPKFIEEKYSITMGLSEADFGSDLPNIRTRAEQTESGWFITGSKRYQTMACGLNGNPSAILCLARTGDATSGARGLSFFIVEGKDVQVTGIEKKLGLKASATCEVVFDRAPAVLVGKEGFGLVKYVIGMLNGARMSVAAQGTGIATAAFFESRKYASERIQFGKPIAEIPAVAKMLERMEREIAAMRCLMIEAAASVDKYHWRSEYLKEDGADDRTIRNDEQIKKWEKLANILTPISKYYNSELCNSITYDAIQVFGGAGFIEEYDVARLYRDARITNIYDGTTQIQINAAIGGIVAGMGESGSFRQYLLELLSRTGKQRQLEELFEILEKTVMLFKELDSYNRDKYSFEIVELATRFINSALLVRTVIQLTSPENKKREKLAHQYLIDSLAIGAATSTKLKYAESSKEFIVSLPKD